MRMRKGKGREGGRQAGKGLGPPPHRWSEGRYGRSYADLVMAEIFTATERVQGSAEKVKGRRRKRLKETSEKERAHLFFLPLF